MSKQQREKILANTPYLHTYPTRTVSKFNDAHLYDISDLISIWKKGWRELAKLCNRLNVYCEVRGFGESKDSVAYRVYYGFDNILCDILWCKGTCKLNTSSIFYLAKAKPGQYSLEYCKSSQTVYPDYHDQESSKKGNEKTIAVLKKIIPAFIKNKTFGEALLDISDKNNVNLFVREILSGGKTTVSDIMSITFTDCQSKSMEWLLSGLKGKDACDEAWWNCVWLEAKSTIEVMLDIQDHIKNDIPLTGEHIKRLNKQIFYGHPRGNWIKQKDGKQIFDTFLELNSKNLNAGYPMELFAKALLVQPAYVLSQQLREKCSTPRFVKKCCAPSCGQLFYTGDARMITCKRRYRDKQHKPLCQLEWLRFKRWLNNNAYKPKMDFDNQNLKNKFLAKDKTYYTENKQQKST